MSEGRPAPSTAAALQRRENRGADISVRCGRFDRYPQGSHAPIQTLTRS